MHPQDDVAVPPQLLKIVIDALFWRKDVDDDVAEVHQNPARVGLSLDAPGHHTGVLLGFQGNVFGQRFQLALIVAVAE